METDMIKYEVQRLDGTPVSIMKAINLILSRFTDNPDFKLPMSAEAGFFQEAHKCILNWIIENDGIAKTKELLDELYKVIKTDEVLAAPFIATGYKYRFAAKLSCMYDLLEILVESDLTIKFYIGMTRPDYTQPRNLLANMWKLDRAVTKQEISVMFTEVSASENDLQYLIDQNLVQEKDLEGETSFELTPKAFWFLNKIKLK